MKMAALSTSTVTSTVSALTSQNRFGIDEGANLVGAEQCYSVLVETGVYSPDDETDQEVN